MYKYYCIRSQNKKRIDFENIVQREKKVIDWKLAIASFPTIFSMSFKHMYEIRLSTLFFRHINL